MKIIARIILGIALFLIVSLLCIYAFIQVRKPQILASINENLQTYINGEIHVENIGFTFFHDFPKASLKLEGLYLRGPKYALYGKDFLKIETLFMSVSPSSIFSKNIHFKELSLVNAEVFIFKTRDGFTNLEVFKHHKQDSAATKNTDASKPISLHLEKLNISNTRIFFLDSLKEKYFGLELVDTQNKIIGKDSSYQINLKGKVDFIGLTFNAQKGTFLKNKSTDLDLHLSYLTKQKTLVVNPSKLALKTGEINIKGAFIFNKPLAYQLNIKTDSIEIAEGLSTLADTVQYKLKKIGAYGYAAANVEIKGIAQPGIPPHIRIDFSTKNAAAKLFGKQHLDQLFVKGYYLNHIPNTVFKGREYSSVKIDTLQALSDGIPIHGRVSMFNMADPDLEVDVIINGNLLGLNAQLDSTKMKVLSGVIEGKVYYKGKLHEYENERLMKLRGALSGYVKVNNGKLYLVKKDLTLKGIVCYLTFDKEQVNIHKIGIGIDKDKLNLKGMMLGYIPFFTQPDPKSKLSLNIESDHIHLEHFFKKNQRKDKKQKKKALGKTLQAITNLEEKMDIDIHLRAKNVTKGGFKAKDLKADLYLKNNSIQLKSVSMNFAGGSYILKGKMDKVSADWSPIDITATMKGVRINEIMKAFNNFGLKGITHENISGIFGMQVNVKGMIDERGGFMNNYLQSDIRLSIKNGQLINFEPIMHIGENVYRNKDLTHVNFAEIIGRITTKGSESEVEKMEISTNLIRMFVEGHHSTVGLSTFMVQVPLLSLTEKNNGIKPENIGVDAKKGLSVFLKLEANKGEKFKVSYIPFPKKKK
jgi:uncharacterized protein involved in outer membrane biogenesis